MDAVADFDRLSAVPDTACQRVAVAVTALAKAYPVPAKVVQVMVHVTDSVTLRGAVKVVYSACPVASQAPLHAEMLKLVVQVEKQYGVVPTSSTLTAFFVSAAPLLVTLSANPKTAWLDLALQIVAMDGIPPSALPLFAKVADEASLRQALWTVVTTAVPATPSATLTAVLTLLSKAATKP